MEDFKLNLHMNEKQYDVINQAEELYNQLELGNFECIDNLIYLKELPINHKQAVFLLNKIKEIYSIQDGENNDSYNKKIIYSFPKLINKVDKANKVNNTYDITISSNCASNLNQALELYCRLNLSQFDHLDFFMSCNVKNLKFEDSEKVRLLQDELKKTYFPELQYSGYYGVFSDKVSQDAKIAWDIQQVIRYCLAWERNPLGGITVEFGSPMQCSNEELITCKVVND